jgi:hypothetical protein
MRPFVKTAAWAGIITALAAAVSIASFMRFSIPEWFAVFVMPALPGVMLTIFLGLGTHEGLPFPTDLAPHVFTFLIWWGLFHAGHALWQRWVVRAS